MHDKNETNYFSSEMWVVLYLTVTSHIIGQFDCVNKRGIFLKHLQKRSELFHIIILLN